MRNRVTPYAEIVDIPLRGTFMGNRGCIHRGTEITRRWNGRRWITCLLEFKGWRAPMWQPGRWTALFFHDEAVALAAGHRPCALCRRDAYTSFQSAWAEAIGGSTRAADMDARLHMDRLDGQRQRRVRLPWPDLPTGAFVMVDASALLVHEDELVPWTTAGYGQPRERPTSGDVTVLTPLASIGVLQAGFPIA